MPESSLLTRERRQARRDERLSDYATRAGARALEASGVEAANLDRVIVATLSQADGRLRPGANVLRAAFGAGFTRGAGVLQWGGPDA